MNRAAPPGAALKAAKWQGGAGKSIFARLCRKVKYYLPHPLVPIMAARPRLLWSGRERNAMPRAMRWLDAAGAWGLVLIGCMHNFLGAPARFQAIGDDLFWFLSAGLALWYAGASNLVRQAGSSRAATIASVPVNLTLLAFIGAHGLHTGD